ncbi:ATP-binding cassette domain-containing protein [Enterobacter cloacae]|uniref:ATP-binding cassette domain-containing protein n=1 Tax=Enterobacter cloacae TaxID=550 RepID=UPI0034D57B06
MLNITNLSADYGGKPALENINLTLDSGELLVVLGPSGCGKTTLLNLMPGLCHISMAPFNWKVKKWRARALSVGWSFRTKVCFPGATCRKTCRLGCNWRA